MSSRVGLDVLSYTGLDAMNLSQREFFFGPVYLADRAKDITFPFISTNISSKFPMPWLKKYIIKEIGKQKVAILGVLPENSFTSYVNPLFVQNLKIEAPEKALKETIAEIKDQAKIFILLSQLNVEETGELLKKIPEINLAVAHSEDKMCTMTDDPGQIIVPNSVNGQFFLTADISVDSEGKVKVSQNPPLPLDDSVNHTADIDAMILTPFNEAKVQRMAAKRAAAEKLSTPGTVGLKPLSKEEFFAEVNKRKAELRKLKPAEGKEVKAKLYLDGEEIPATIRVIRPEETASDQSENKEKVEKKQ